MKNTRTCPKCRSKDVMSGLPIPDRYDLGMTSDLELKASENPEAWFFKGTKSSPLLAHVCGSCGFTELYLENPRELWAAYRRSPRG